MFIRYPNTEKWLRKRGAEHYISSRENKACTGFEPMTAAILLQRSNNRLNKPTGTRHYVGFQINPWSGVKMTVEI